MKKIHIIYGLFWILALFTIFQFTHMPAKDVQPEIEDDQHRFVKGQVIDIKDNEYFIAVSDQKGKVVKTGLNDYFIHDDYKKGDLLNLYVSASEDGETQYDIADFYHLDGLIFGFIIFCALAIFAAKKKGIYSIVSILLSLFLFYGIILSAIKGGISVILAGIIYVFFITVLTIPIIHGFNKKSASAIISVNIGYIFGFLLTYLFIFSSKIGNTPAEEFRTLFIQFPDTNMREILIIALFLGAVGALIDVAISICSAVFEGLKEHPDLTLKKAYSLGMEVGRDILGSMINTLLLAYIAASFPFLVLMSKSGFNNIVEFLNYDFVALELTRILIGASSIILLIPVTSVITAYIASKKMKII